jgi:hypothetical protein
MCCTPRKGAVTTSIAIAGSARGTKKTAAKQKRAFLTTDIAK